MMSSYNYKKFDQAHYDLQNFAGPEAGTKAPDGEVRSIEGPTRRLLDFEGLFLVLEFGSITCPLFQTRRRVMGQLPAEFTEVDFVVLYSREAHPGKFIAAHADMDDKVKQARLLRDGDGEAREILIDGMEGPVHSAYGGFPNAVFIINRNGCIVYRSAWNNTGATRRALKRLLVGTSVPSEGYFLPANPRAAFHTLKQAGKGSGVDFVRSFPYMFWKNLIRRNVLLAVGQRHRIGPDSSC